MHRTPQLLEAALGSGPEAWNTHQVGSCVAPWRGRQLAGTIASPCSAAGIQLYAWESIAVAYAPRPPL